MRNVIDTEHVSIRETSPGKRVIQTHVGTYYLDFPYIQYYFYKDKPELMVSATKKPFSTKESNELFQVPTFNIAENGQVCQSIALNGDGTTNQLKTIEFFWNTSFSKDLPPKGFRASTPTHRQATENYYDYWQKNGWFEIPFSYWLSLFPHDPNYYKSPETYFEAGRLVCFVDGIFGMINRFEPELNNILVTPNFDSSETFETQLFLRKNHDVRITETANTRLNYFRQKEMKKTRDSYALIQEKMSNYRHLMEGLCFTI